MYIGLPGGRTEKQDKNDKCTAAREVYEEIGLIIPHLDINNTNVYNLLKKQNDLERYENEIKNCKYDYIGRLDDRAMIQNGKKFVISCLIYLQTEFDENPEYRIKPNEVGACGFVDLDYLINDNSISPLIFNLKNTLFAQEHPIITKLASSLKLHKLRFTKTYLNIDPLLVENEIVNDEKQKKEILDNFFLWGLTLGMLNEFLVQTKLRSYPLTVSDKYMFLGRVDRIFGKFIYKIIKNNFFK